MKIGIIGSAGRKDDGPKLDKAMWGTMLSHANLSLERLVPAGESIHLVSGGAAGADHLAVALFMNNIGDNLTLHLPAGFKDSKFLTQPGKLDPGQVANYYHEMFRQKTDVPSLRQLAWVLAEGASHTVSSGFHARNLLVGNVDLLLAYTFGTDTCLIGSKDPRWKNHELAGLKDGGTAHTWNNSNAPIKLHTNLQDWT